MQIWLKFKMVLTNKTSKHDVNFKIVNNKARDIQSEQKCN